jgi:putative transposase
MLAMAIERELDAVVRQHQLRKTDFLRGRILNRRDHVVCWERPQKPKWMDQETYDRMPLTLEVREIEVAVEVPGFRATSFVVATTLIDATAYTTSDIASLYHDRWQVELDIRALKISMGLDVLRCKSPEMVRKEIGVGLLAYNLIRRKMLQAAWNTGRLPRQLSFTATMQQVGAAWGIAVLLGQDKKSLLSRVTCDNLTQHQVGNRPNRIEPRAIKRRPKSQRLLTKPRHAARNDPDLVGGKKSH